MPFLFFNAELLLYGPSCMVVMALVLVRCVRWGRAVWPS